MVEITEYKGITSNEVYSAIETMCKGEEECIRILYNDKVVTFIQTRNDQLKWLINQDLDRLANNRVLKYMSDYNGGKKK